jgi:cytochrome c
MKLAITTISLAASFCFAADGAGIYAAKCAMCHGADGKDAAVSGKVIAGLGDAEAKIKGYKAGTIGGANKASMQGSVSDISDADIAAVASYVSSLK